MLAKTNRLTTREFALVIGTGRELHSPFFSIKSIPGETFKFGQVASKKIWKTAVSRNRVRRRVYAAVRSVISGKKVKPVHCIIFVKRNLDAVEPAQLSIIINELFVNARLIA
jgi:ribonuclease P protein component